jgi:ATP-binding cassette subfamily C protein LapB
MNIVRALTNRPRILALDEANVPLDAISEPAMIRALNSLRGALTVIVVTHRPSLLALCDHKLIVQDGHVDWLFPSLDDSRKLAT